jgi:hypothetical protein
MIGLNGLCSVYDPPVSYWCSEHPSGGGAFAFRTPSGVIPSEGALPNAPYQSVKDALFFVWRPGRWANWIFEIEQYDKRTGNFTFGKGGNQGARGSNNGGDFFSIFQMNSSLTRQLVNSICFTMAQGHLQKKLNLLYRNCARLST